MGAFLAGIGKRMLQAEEEKLAQKYGMNFGKKGQGSYPNQGPMPPAAPGEDTDDPGAPSDDAYGGIRYGQFGQGQDAQIQAADPSNAVNPLAHVGPETALPSVGTTMPHFAEGGVVTKPTIALIGEKEPEVVIPLRPHSGQRMSMSGMGLAMGLHAPHAGPPHVPRIRYR